MKDNATEKQVSVFGVTNNPQSIATMLGVNDENDYALYQETALGRYYARKLPDGTLDTANMIRLISDEQAVELETTLCQSIQDSVSQILDITASVPAPDLETFEANLQAIRDKNRTQAEAIQEKIRVFQEVLASTPKTNLGALSKVRADLSEEVQKQIDTIRARIQSAQAILASAPTIKPDAYANIHFTFSQEVQEQLNVLKVKIQNAQDVLASTGEIDTNAF